MSAPLGGSYDLQCVIAAVINASAVLQGLIGNPPRLFERPSPRAAHPYLVFGADHSVPDLVQGLDGAEIYPEIHIWSKAGSYAEIKIIGAALNAVIAALPETLAENRLVLIEPESARHMTDPDGVTLHGVYTWRALVEPND